MRLRNPKLATACFSIHSLEFFSSLVTGHYILNVNSFSQQILSTCPVLESAPTLGDTVVNLPSKEELWDF